MLLLLTWSSLWFDCCNSHSLYTCSLENCPLNHKVVFESHLTWSEPKQETEKKQRQDDFKEKSYKESRDLKHLLLEMKRNLSWIIQWPYPRQAWVQSHWFCAHEPSCSFQPVLATAYDTWVAEETKQNENTWTPSHVIMACWHKGIRTTESTKVTEISAMLPNNQENAAVAGWSACRTRNPAVLGSSPTLSTTWICFSVAPSSNPRPPL